MAHHYGYTHPHNNVRGVGIGGIYLIFLKIFRKKEYIYILQITYYFLVILNDSKKDKKRYYHSK